MTRYFQSMVTGRPLTVGGRSFIFEPVEPLGGSWLGVLAVDDESAASILAADGSAVWEITAEQFESLKKKQTGRETPQGFGLSQTPRLPPQPLQAAAAPAGHRADFNSDGAVRAVPESVRTTAAPVASIELKTTDQRPPDEALFDSPAPKRKKAA
jgi:hypothetical protein